MDKLQRDLGDEGTWKMNHIKAKKRDDDPEPTCSLDSYLGKLGQNKLLRVVK